MDKGRHSSRRDLFAAQDPVELFESVDTDGNGQISLAEFKQLHNRVVAEERSLQRNEGRALEEASTQRRNKVYYQKVATALLLGLLLIIGANAAMTAAVVFLTKDVGVNSEGVMINPITGDALRVSSADTSVSSWGGLVDSATGKTVQTAETAESQTLDSRLPDSVWQEIRFLEFSSESGGYLHLAVTAAVRKPDDTALHGSIVTMYTALGWIELDADIVTFHESMAGVFTSAGFEVAGERRRLSSAFVLIGLFNSVPAFEGWNTTYDSPPKIPETYHAQIEYLHPCKQLDRETGLTEDLCAEHGVPDEYIADEHGTSRTGVAANAGAPYSDGVDSDALMNLKLYARVGAEIWADAATSMQRESFNNMANLGGWTLDRVTSALGAADTQDVAQTWQPTGERFFCRTAPGPKAISFSPDLWIAAYKGELVHNNTDAMKFLVKHRRTNNVSVEYITTVPETVDGVLTVYPLQITANLTRADDPRVQELIVNFNTFDALSTVDPSIFSWGLDAPFTNATACESTLNMTTPYDERGWATGYEGVIPRDMKIAGSAPFMPFLGAPDSTPFFQALRSSPYSTAQEIIRAIENGTIVLNSTDDIEDDAVVAGRMSIDAYVAEQARLDEFNIRDNSTTYTSAENETRRQLETEELETQDQETKELETVFHGVVDTRNDQQVGRQLQYNDYCSDDDTKTKKLKFIKFADCSIEVSQPRLCKTSFSCEADVAQFGPVVLGLMAAIAVDCTDDFSQCLASGCLALSLALGIRGFSFTFLTIQVCILAQVFKCNHCKAPYIEWRRHCETYREWRWWWPGWQNRQRCWWKEHHLCRAGQEEENQVVQFIYSVSVEVNIVIAGFEGTLLIYDNTHCPTGKCNGLYHKDGDNREGQGRDVRLHGRVYVCIIWCGDVWSGWIV